MFALVVTSCPFAKTTGVIIALALTGVTSISMSSLEHEVNIVVVRATTASAIFAVKPFKKLFFFILIQLKI